MSAIGFYLKRVPRSEVQWEWYETRCCLREMWRRALLASLAPSVSSDLDPEPAARSRLPSSNHGAAIRAGDKELGLSGLA